MHSPPFPLYLVPPRSKYSPQHHVLKHPQLPFLPQCQRPIFTPIQKCPIWKVVLNYAMSWGKHRLHKIRRHCRQNTHTHTHTRKGIYIIGLIIFKRKVKERNDEWFKLMTNLIQECVGVLAHLIRIWKNEFLCTQGLLPASINTFHCLHQPNPGEGRCVDFEYTSVSYCLSSKIRTQPYYCVLFSWWQR